MALTKATVTENLNPAQAQAQAVPLTAAVVSDGLDAALYEPTIETLDTAQQVSVIAADTSIPAQQAAVYVAPQEQEDEGDEGGFDSLDEEVNFTSFPMAKIKAGQITINGVKPAGDLVVKCVKIAYQWIIKSSKAKDAKYYFSPDGGKTDMKGNSGDEIKRDWVLNFGADAKQINMKKYGVVHAVDKASQAMIAISIPPSSLGRLAGYKNELGPLGRPPITEVWTKCLLGDVAEASVDGEKVNWTPWNFKYVEPVALANGLVS